MEVEISQLGSQNIDHLGLVAAMCKQLKIVELIDHMLPPSPHAKVTHGERVQAMILNGLGYSARTLYLNSEFLEGKPLERFFRTGVQAAFFNDDALGTTHDALHEKDVTQLYVAHRRTCYQNSQTPRQQGGAWLSVFKRPTICSVRVLCEESESFDVTDIYHDVLFACVCRV